MGDGDAGRCGGVVGRGRCGRSGAWRDWILAGDSARAAANYAADFPVHQQVYDHAGLGISKMHFSTPRLLKAFQKNLLAALAAAL